MHKRLEARITEVAIRTPDGWFMRDGNGGFRPATRGEVRKAAQKGRGRGADRH